VHAHLLAGDLLLAGGEEARRINGRPYFVSSGEPVEIWDFVSGMLEAAGAAPIRKSVSLRTALAVGWVFEKVHAISGRKGDPRMSRWIVRQLTDSRWFDISAARRDLGYEPQVSMEEGMRRLKTWLDNDDRDDRERDDRDRNELGAPRA
jgi:nucleoside-diphosphate-sugar epimerase